jgi:hypothetical protein
VRCERCVGKLTNGCTILVGEVERSCVEFGLGPFGSKGIVSVATKLQAWNNDGMIPRGENRRTRNKTSTNVTAHALAWDRTGSLW